MHNAIAALPNGGHIVVWHQWEDGNWYLRYQMLDADGNLSGPIRALQPSGGGQLVGSAETLAVSVAPDGVIGIAWQQVEYLRNNEEWHYRYNVLWAAVDAAGNQLLAPTDLTGNTAFTTWDAPGATRFYAPKIAASGNSRFVVAWETEMRTNGGWISNVFFTMRDSANSVIKPVTHLSWRSDLGLNRSQNPVLAGLADGRVVLGYYDYTRDETIPLVILSNAGEMVAQLRLSAKYGISQAVTQLSTGPILALWTEWGELFSKPALYYALLDSSTLATLAGPTKLDNPSSATGDFYASLAATADGRAVITWGEYDWSYRRYQYYALIGQNGAVLTPATPFLTAKTPTGSILPRLGVNSFGYGIAVNRAFDPTSTTLPDPAVTAPALAAGAPSGGAQVQIAVTNRGLPATGAVAVTAELDPQLTYIGATPKPSSIDAAAAYAGAAGPVVHWDLPSLDYLTMGKIVLSTGMPTTTTIGSTFPVTITVTHVGDDANPGNSTVQTQVIAVNQLFLPAAMNNED